MAYDEELAGRVRAVFATKGVRFREQKMMGGLCFMVNDKMCVGVEKNKLMARVGPAQYAQALRKPGGRQMDFTGRPMRGFVFVEPAGLGTKRALENWIQMCLDYNPDASSSKKKTKPAVGQKKKKVARKKSASGR